MFGKNWQLSEREYEVVVERDVTIPVDDGIELVGDLFRPDADGEFPVILSASPYNVAYQHARITPRASSGQNAWIESGDPYFFARRGYAHAIVNVRGTGKSGGEFRNLGPREVEDLVAAVEWLADRPWADGNVGMTGISYFGMVQPFVAERAPEPLEAIFAPWAATDLYRDWHYHGGVFQHGMAIKWSQQLDNLRPYGWSRANLDDDEFEARVEAKLRDEEVRAHPVLVEALENPEEGEHPFLVDLLVNDRYEPGGYWDERRLDYARTDVPGYFGADWSHQHIHVAAGFRNFRHWDGPRKLLVGPPQFVDRPFSQLAYESLRWFDHWLKDEDTGMLEEPTVRLFRMGAGTWKTGEEWPLPETKWTPFYLHPDGLLWEGDHFPMDGYDTYEDSPFGRGGLSYWSPPLVERTELVGPTPLHLHVSTTAEEVLLFATLLKRTADGEEETLAKGWLRGSHRAVDEERSEPWRVHRPHDDPEPVPPGEVVEYRVTVRSTATVFDPGERIGVRVTSADVDETDPIDVPHRKVRAAYENGRHLSRQSPSRVTVYHDEARPSRALLPVTAGNVMGTYRSAGGDATFDERAPYEKIQTDERE